MVRRGLISSAVVLLLLLGGYALVLRQQARRFSTQLAEEARLVETSLRPRPVHRPPSLPGTAAGCYAAAVRATGPDWLQRLFECTHYETLQTHDGVGPLGVRTDPLLLEHLGDIEGRLTTLGALINQRRAAQGPGSALELCADVAAVARDLSWLRSFDGMLNVMIVAANITGPCGVAIDEASATEKAAFRAQLQLVRAGLAPFGVVLEQERVEQALLRFGVFMPDDVRATLTPGAADFARRSLEMSAAHSFAARLGTRLFWRPLDAAMHEAVRVADAPIEGRSAAVRVALAPLDTAKNRFVMGGTLPMELQYHLYVDHHERLARAVDLLLTAATLDGPSLGETPTPPSVLVSRSGDAVVLHSIDTELRALVTLHADVAVGQ